MGSLAGAATRRIAIKLTAHGQKRPLGVKNTEKYLASKWYHASIQASDRESPHPALCPAEAVEKWQHRIYREPGINPRRLPRGKKITISTRPSIKEQWLCSTAWHLAESLASPAACRLLDLVLPAARFLWELSDCRYAWSAAAGRTAAGDMGRA